MKKQVALIILDGWGYREDGKNNAINQANKPNFDNMWKNYPHTTLVASGLSVGLPENQMGNSEVGHMTIGAGRAIDQDLVRINKEIVGGNFKKNQSLIDLFDYVNNNKSTLHVIGLLSHGGVHSHMEHLFAFIKLAKENNIEKIIIHPILDGRDAPPQSGSIYMKKLEDEIKELGKGKIGSMSGRYYAMDRDHNWDRLDKYLDVIISGKSDFVCETSPSLFLGDLYKKEKIDELLEPIICLDEKGQKSLIEKNDGIFIFNFRADRMRMLTSKILEKKLKLVTMTKYHDDFNCPVAYSDIVIETTLAKVLSENNKTQTHIAETEKYAHATYFLDGGVEIPYKGEEYVLIPSRKDIKTHDLAPEMRAKEIADKIIEEINKGTDFIFANFANVDMVGHTANVPAIIKAVEFVDLQLGRILQEINKKNRILIITADHGNAEINIDDISGDRHTAHTANPVPCIIITSDQKIIKENGGLADITPTILKIFDIEKPDSMTGESLI